MSILRQLNKFSYNYDEIINIPGSIKNIDVIVSNTKPSSMSVLKYEIMVSIVNGNRKIIKSNEELEGLVHIESTETALKFVRFLFSPGIRHLLHNIEMNEIINYSDRANILFRTFGLYFDAISSQKIDGFEGFLHAETYNKLKLDPLRITKKDKYFLINRNVVIKNFSNYDMYRTEEILRFNGIYKMIKRNYISNKNIKWYFFDINHL